MNHIVLNHLRNGQFHEAKTLILDADPTEKARCLAAIEPSYRLALFAELPPKEAVATFLHMDDEEQAGLLEHMGKAEAARFAARLPSYTIARAVALLSRRYGDELLALLPAKKRESVQTILRHDADNVVRVMRSDHVAVTADTTVAEAMARLRGIENSPEDMGAVVFVTNAEGEYLGHVSLTRLLRAESDTPIRSLVNGEGVTAGTHDNKVDAARLLQRSDLPVLPILDDQRRLAGVLCFSDAMDVLEEDVSEDVYKKAGIGSMVHAKDVVRSEKLTSGPIGYSVRIRLAFLMVTLAGGLMVGGVIDFFEDTLAALVALAIFIPLVMDMGGNVGTQSTTIFARGLALGHISMERFFRSHLVREAMVGLAMASVIAVLAGTIAYFWQGAPNGIPLLGVVVGVALFTAVFTASILGFLLPWVMVKIGVDHAPGADPFITTIKDFTGLAVYFLMAAWLLGAHIPGGA
ncbi:magnesium transporter [Ectothiorhodospira sp. PHS-1]|uniref:magnesium transporter n=1 Tax=Ectothiorhodospira sp. PHS-1 TaxID=519989 RepID=UPI00024A81F8|nr:magnesium transporter [Ectothiorhodospira sp. PHS-1]EHQ52631.1 magnesium transporter [Ectothiorhodospira sp. PHS-1]